MATIASSELDGIRQEFAKDSAAVGHQKATLNAAAQAVEDWWESNRASLGAAIDAATSPSTLSVQEKRDLAKHWLVRKAQRGG